MINAISGASRSDEWFAWYPVRLGAIGVGRWVWMQHVWRNRCMEAMIYQDLPLARASEAALKSLLASSASVLRENAASLADRT